MKLLDATYLQRPEGELFEFSLLTLTVDDAGHYEVLNLRGRLGGDGEFERIFPTSDNDLVNLSWARWAYTRTLSELRRDGLFSRRLPDSLGRRLEDLKRYGPDRASRQTGSTLALGLPTLTSLPAAEWQRRRAQPGYQVQQLLGGTRGELRVLREGAGVVFEADNVDPGQPRKYFPPTSVGQLPAVLDDSVLDVELIEEPDTGELYYRVLDLTRYFGEEVADLPLSERQELLAQAFNELAALSGGEPGLLVLAPALPSGAAGDGTLLLRSLDSLYHDPSGWFIAA